jgi:hypothetical protein
MMLVLVALFVLLGVVVLAIQVAEPAVDRRRSRRQPPAPAAEAAARPAGRERIVLSVGIR